MDDKVFTGVVVYKFCHPTSNQNSNELSKQKIRCRNFLAGLSQISPLCVAWENLQPNNCQFHPRPRNGTERKIQG